MDILKREYREAFGFLRQVRAYIIIAAALFAVFSVAAYFAAAAVYSDDPDLVLEHLEGMNEMIESKDLVDEQGNISAAALFFNNFTAAVIAAAAGAVPFLFLPALSLVINAAVLGAVAGIMKALGAGGFFELFVSVAPHGIIEIPALVICIAFGIKLCAVMTLAVIGRTGWGELPKTVGGIARAVVLAVTPMLAAAAFIEAYITPALMGIFLKIP